MSDTDETDRQDAVANARRVPLRYAFARFGQRERPEVAEPGAGCDRAAAAPPRPRFWHRLIALLRDRIAD